ncbi:MAG: MFS transporter [Corynebacteriales bacterium]|nr:MFS transporter [Mycobacteriales bacterium]
MITDDEPDTGRWRELLGPARVAISLVLAGGVALHAINIFLTTSLLPTAIEEIGGAKLYAWSTTIFMIASVISAMLVSRILGASGPAKAYLIGFASYIVGTLICAISPTMEILLIGRAVQGIGGGLLAGLAYMVVQGALPAHLWAKATALISAMWGVGTLAGPAIGGLFAQFDAWRYAFVLLALFGALIALVATRVLPSNKSAGERDPVPVVSLFLLTATTAAISVAGVMTSRINIFIAIGVAVVLLLAFITRERTKTVQVLPASTYKLSSPLKWIYLTIAILAAGTATEAFIPLFGQRLAGLEPFVAGFLGAAVSLGWSVSMVFSANASRPRTLSLMRIIGPGVLAIGLAIAGLTQREDAGPVVVVMWVLGLIIAGSGIGIAFPHLIVGAMKSSTDPEEAGKASAGVNTVELIALAFASALGGVLVNLGAPSMVNSAKYLLLGFAVVAAIGCLTAFRAERAHRNKESLPEPVELVAQV